jgi:hypothetical protein
VSGAGGYSLLHVGVGGESFEIEGLLKRPQKDKPYTNHRNFDWLQAYDLEFMDRPAYRPDLATSDLHVFLDPFKRKVAEKQFAPDADLKRALTSWLQKPETDFEYMLSCHSRTNI